MLHREGAEDPLTIVSAEPVADGPGWRVRFREIPDRNAADALRNAYLEAIVDPARELSRGEYYWHEVVGSAVRGVDGAELGTVRDVYRVAETEVFEVAGGPFGPFDLPAVRDFIRVFAPRRGEIVVDAEALDLQAAGGSRGAGGPGARSPPSDEQANGQDEARSGRSVLMALEIDVLTLFPTMIEGPLAASIPGRIQERGLATVRVHDLRDWGLGRHRTVDDTTYGGGAGMVLRPEPVAAALGALRRPDTLSILLDPAGEVFRQSRAVELAAREHLLLVCARYEGVDERIRSMVDLELSIGDYVLTGGELAALVVIDSVIRLLPGAIDEASTAEESFTHGLLEYPQYTRPPSFDGAEVPPILVSGDHGAVRRWRLKESLRRTLERRPDLLVDRPASPEERRLLDELAQEGDGSAGRD